MKNILSLTLAVMLFFGLGCKKDDPVTPPAGENVAGTYYRTLNTSDGQERQYIVYIPESASGTVDVPLLLMIHGTNQTGQVHYDKNLWNAKADQEGFIVVYPTALVYCHFDEGLERTTTKWAAGDLGQTDVNRGALPLCAGEVLKDDMLFFDELVSALKSDYSVDEKRIYLSGFSNGAQMTARLAAERPETYAAATVHAGNMSDFIPATLSTRPMSLLLTAGANDGLFATAVGMSVPIPVDSNLLDNAGVANAIQPFLNICGLSNSFSYSSNQYGGGGVANFLFETSDEGLDNSLTFILIEGLGHSYTDILIDPYWTFLRGESLP